MKKLLLIMILATVVASVSAQEPVRYDQTLGTYERVTQRGPYLTNRFFDNIFLGIGGGVNLYMGEGDSKGKFESRLAPAIDISLGKWVTPAVGVRLQYTGIQAKGFSTVQTGYTNGEADDDLYTKKFNMMNLHGDFLWNISNAIGGYKETRTWDFVPFIGFGVARSEKNSNSNVQLAANVGLLNKIRLGKVVDLTLEAKYMIVKPEFDKFVVSDKIDGMASLTAGISIKFGPGRGFKRPERPIVPDYTPYTHRITNLESDLSQSQRVVAENKAKVDNLNRELEAARNRPAPETVVVKVSAPASMTIFFKIGSYAISEKDMVNLSNIADYINKSQERVFKVVGYADSSTGSVATNERLSRLRAQSVADALIQKFGVKSTQLVVDNKGGVSYDANPVMSRMVKIE